MSKIKTVQKNAYMWLSAAKGWVVNQIKFTKIQTIVEAHENHFVKILLQNFIWSKPVDKTELKFYEPV